METNTVIAEIDAVHLEADLALKNKDLNTYMERFSDNLKYKQLNGKTIDKNQLLKDTLKYFNRIKNYSSNYDRLSFSIDNDFFIEKITQKAVVTIQVFVFFSKKWAIEREGIYKWEKINNKWKIIDVEIINEKLY